MKLGDEHNSLSLTTAKKKQKIRKKDQQKIMGESGRERERERERKGKK